MYNDAARVTLQTASLLAIASAFALLANAFSPVGIPVTRALTLRELDARYLTAEEAHARHEAGQSIFLDARPEKLFERGHIPGALVYPADEFEQRFLTTAAWLPKETELVVYCDGKGCGLSRQLADKLAAAGYTRVVIFYEGWKAWDAHCWPVER
ncbi:MAG: rhodanese-like domain-containing protein [Verrucomicrobiae bacterium]|nr:rhodanese-like domain-containing protein [Verrucomicrobiae bacterium]